MNHVIARACIFFGVETDEILARINHHGHRIFTLDGYTMQALHGSEYGFCYPCSLNRKQFLLSMWVHSCVCPKSLQSAYRPFRSLALDAL